MNLFLNIGLRISCWLVNVCCFLLEKGYNKLILDTEVDYQDEDTIATIVRASSILTDVTLEFEEIQKEGEFKLSDNTNRKLSSVIKRSNNISEKYLALLSRAHETNI